MASAICRPTGITGIERRHRLLKDHGDLAAAIVAHLLRLQGQQVRALETDRAFDARRGIQQPQDGQ